MISTNESRAIEAELEPWVGRYNEQKARFLAEFVR